MTLYGSTLRVWKWYLGRITLWPQNQPAEGHVQVVVKEIRLVQSFLLLVTFSISWDTETTPFLRLNDILTLALVKGAIAFQCMLWGRGFPGTGTHLCMCRGWTRSVAMQFRSHQRRAADVIAPSPGSLGLPRMGPGLRGFWTEGQVEQSVMGIRCAGGYSFPSLGSSSPWWLQCMMHYKTTTVVLKKTFSCVTLLFLLSLLQWLCLKEEGTDVVPLGSCF